jgi:hypothetical protein
MVRSLATTEKHPQSFSFVSCSYCKGKRLFCQELFTFRTKGFFSLKERRADTGQA